MKVRFLKHFATSSAIFLAGNIYCLPEVAARNYIMAGLCAVELDDRAAVEPLAVPEFQLATLRQPETTSRRRGGR